MNRRCTKFPPVWGHLEIPTSTRQAALAGLSLYAPCKRWTIIAHRFTWVMISALGPSVLPGKRDDWTPPMEDETWRGLLRQWEERLGRSEGFAVHHRRPAGREGFNLLVLRDDEPRAFLKLRCGVDTRLRNEYQALDRVRAFGPKSFRAPECLALGEHDGWHYLALTPLPAKPHRPPRHPQLQRVVEEIEAALRSLPRAAETPTHWRPMHGDLTPWNLRRLDDGPLILFDWEDAGWGPPGADEVLFRASAAALGAGGVHRVASGGAHEEALAYWQDRLMAQSAAGRGGLRKVARLLRQGLRNGPTGS